MLKKFSLVLVALNFLIFRAHADGQLIASCSYAGDSQNPAEQIQVYRNGTDNTASAISMHFASGNVGATLQAVEVDPTDGGQTLEIRYGRGGFLTLMIHQGNRSDNLSGVALGTSHRDTCQASF